MSEPDREMAEYLNKNFGPFLLEDKQTLTSRKRQTDRFGNPYPEIEPIQCDLCGARVWTFLKCRPVDITHSAAGAVSRLQICLGEECTGLIIPEYSWMDSHGNADMLSPQEYGKAVAIGRAVKKFTEVPKMIPYKEYNQKVLVNAAAAFLGAGMGKSWKIVPNIVEVGKTHRLSSKQLGILQKFINTLR